MRFSEALAPVTAAALIAAGGVPARHNTTSQSLRTGSTPERIQDQSSSSDDPEQDMINSLNKFRNNVIRSHRVSEVLLGACVAWGNESGGITVTLNPGIGEVESGGKKYDFLVFSTHDSRYTPSWGPLNGPEIGSPEVLTLAFLPRVIPRGSILNRPVSKQEKRDAKGRRFYTDIQTGAPIMDTELTKGPLSSKRVASVCSDLRQDDPKSATKTT